MLRQGYLHAGAKYAHIHRHYYIHYTYIYIYDGMATQKRWERKTCLQIHVQKICAWYHEKNKKASTEAIQNAWMHGGNKKTASNHITACKLAVALHAHSRKKKKKLIREMPKNGCILQKAVTWSRQPLTKSTITFVHMHKFENTHTRTHRQADAQIHCVGNNSSIISPHLFHIYMCYDRCHN